MTSNLLLRARLLGALACLVLAAAAGAQDRSPVDDAPPKSHKSAPSASEASGEERSTMAIAPGGRSGRGIRPESVQPVPTYAIAPEIWTTKGVFEVGETVDFFFSSNADALIYIFNTDAAGRSTQIFPNWWDQANQIRAGRTYKIPTYNPDNYQFSVVPPAGIESVTILAVAERYPALDPCHSFDQRNIFPQNVPSPFAILESLRGASVPQGGGRQGQGRLAIQPTRPAVEYRYGAATLYFETREPVRMGTVNVSSKPEGALVYVGDLFRGYAPLSVELPEGEHEVLLQMPRFRDDRHSVRVRPGRGQDVRRSLKPIHPPLPPRYGLVWVDAGGIDGAEILIDGELVGEAPLAFAAPTGRREITVQKRGFRSESRKVEVSSNETAYVELNLQRR